MLTSDTATWPAIPMRGQIYCIDRDADLDGLVGTAIFTLEDAIFSNERHEDEPGKSAEMHWLQIGMLRLTREQVALAVGEPAVAAWESSATDAASEGRMYDEIRMVVA